jgi:hypothetical protein
VRSKGLMGISEEKTFKGWRLNKKGGQNNEEGRVL